jgi:transglutaminase-like putative cysteine protease
MPRVHIVHTTSYRYARPVRFTTHRLMLRPRDSHDLRLNSATLGLTPPFADTRWAHDVFGNSVAFVDWGEHVAGDHLKIVSTLKLEHFPGAVPHAADELEPITERFPFSYGAEEFPDLARSLERHYPDPEGAVGRWARKFVKNGEPMRIMALLSAITQAIKGDFTYVAREAEGTNAPARTLESKSGACRDFALLMMEAVRSLGFAARFVSGYLYDEALVDSEEHVIGGGATHAWCEVYIPGAGWVEFDPTNGLVAGRNLIRVCVARTPEQAIPIAGGFIGGRNDFLGMSVDVEVAVGDVPAAAKPAQPAVEVAVKAREQIAV